MIETILQTAREVLIPSRELTTLHLETDLLPSWLQIEQSGEIKFSGEKWCEVLMAVRWDSTNVNGTRFSHTTTTDRFPLHSEAIDALVLAEISNGQQLLRGNSILGAPGIESISLAVWQDSGRPVMVHKGMLYITPL